MGKWKVTNAVLVNKILVRKDTTFSNENIAYFVNPVLFWYIEVNKLIYFNATII